MRKAFPQQISYIAAGAPARRQAATGNEPFLRPEVGFTPNWFRTALGIDFGERWHRDPAYRRSTVLAMREELRRRFPATSIGGIDRPDHPLDLLTGAYGGSLVAMLFGIPAVYASDNWPSTAQAYLSDEEADNIEPVDLDHNDTFRELMDQIDWIAASEGQVLGHVNWQGILNNAQRLRGENIFFDMVDAPNRCGRMFDAIYTTMVEASRRVYARQRETGVDNRFFTVSNCLVNLVSPQQYRDLLFEYEVRFAAEFESLAIHNCAWNADGYMEDYSKIDNVGYIDMGIDSNMVRARELMPRARRALMYTPMDLMNKPWDDVRSDVERIAEQFGPCDLVIADIEAGTPDGKVLDVIELCREISTSAE